MEVQQLFSLDDMKLKPINFPKHNGNHERIIVDKKKNYVRRALA